MMLKVSHCLEEGFDYELIDSDTDNYDVVACIPCLGEADDGRDVALERANLFAAAPELLTACQSILDHWESGNFSREHDLWNGLRAAIAKAEPPTPNAG